MNREEIARLTFWDKLSIAWEPALYAYCAIVYGIATGYAAWGDDQQQRIAFWMVIIYTIGLVLILLFQWRGKKKRILTEDLRSDHDPLLWDKAPYTCIHGVKPHKVTKQCSWPYRHDLQKWPHMPSDAQRAERRPIR